MRRLTTKVPPQKEKAIKYEKNINQQKIKDKQMKRGFFTNIPIFTLLLFMMLLKFSQPLKNQMKRQFVREMGLDFTTMSTDNTRKVLYI